jgi:NAD(P) transhydrogenase subunit alpha
MILGIPREIMVEENRVAAIPETVAKYVQAGHKVLVETLAGQGIFRSDSEYEQAGAEIVNDVTQVFSRANVVLKVKQPEYNEKVGKHEIEMLNSNSVLITFLHPAAPGSRKNVEMLEARGITALTMDGIPRISRAQKMDALTSMSTVTGYRAVLMAAIALPKMIPMTSTAVGVIKPATFLVIGCGVVGLQAIATAKRLGAIVHTVDIRREAREQAETLGAAIGGFDVPDDLAKGPGGYAKALPAEWIEKERQLLQPLVAAADAVVLSALVPGETAPLLITNEMVASMKPGSVIIDVSIDQGGNCVATQPGKEILVNNVKVSGLQNIPGRVAADSTWMYANNMFYFVENAFKDGKTLDINDEIVRSSLVCRNGQCVHNGTLKALGRTQ